MGLLIELAWQPPIRLTHRGKLVGAADEIIQAIEPQKAGVYVFSRRYGSRYEPFYIGQSKRLRGRLKDHLTKNVDLMLALLGHSDAAHEIRQGTRYFQYAFLLGNKVSIDKKLKIVERAMIRKAIADDWYLINKNNTKIETHTVASTGPQKFRAIFDKTVSVESND